MGVVNSIFAKAVMEDQNNTVSAEKSEVEQAVVKCGSSVSKSKKSAKKEEIVFIRCRVTAEENKAIKMYCAENGITVDGLIRRQVMKFINKK